MLRAHDPGISTTQGVLHADRIELTTGFAPADVEQLLPPEARAGRKWGAEEFEAAQERLRTLAPQIWELRDGDVAVPPRESRVQLLPGDNVSFHLVFPRPPGRAELKLRAPKLGELPAGHRQFVIVSDEGGFTLVKKLLNAHDDTLGLGGTKASGAAAGAEPAGEAEGGGGETTFWGFIWLGVEHIWKGYDHLLFLFALLVVCQSFRSIVTIVSCFTLAHSLTLALATLDLVAMPARLVEPAIAASIVFVGVENLWRRGAEPRGRSALTFAFGLIHGFGFASVLRDLGVGAGQEGIAMPLFAFNLGVELGQVAIAAVVMPLIWQLRRKEAFVRRGVPALSALVAAAGLYWLLERTVWG